MNYENDNQVQIRSKSDPTGFSIWVHNRACNNADSWSLSGFLLKGLFNFSASTVLDIYVVDQAQLVPNAQAVVGS